MEDKRDSSLLANRYQLLQVIGTGGMAVVYKAHDLMLERPVAIKILRPDLSKDENFREKSRQEAKSAANLSHQNIVTVHDFGFDHDKLYIVMEHIPGTDLKSIQKVQGKFSVDQAIPLIVQASAGIGYAHRAGLVHCDVKPHNFLVTPEQRLKVTDFGISRALSTINPDEHHDIVWGSPQYFSPEQASGAAPSPASDVYSLGVILYELLTGKLPFDSEDPSELARLHKERSPIPPRQFNPDIPEPLERIILKVLSKEPSARYRTADQLGRILATFSNQAQNFASIIPPSIAETSVNLPSTNPKAVDTPHPRPHNKPQKLNFGGLSSGVSGIDWLTVGLGFMALILVGGLIPFWLYIFLFLTANQVSP